MKTVNDILAAFADKVTIAGQYGTGHLPEHKPGDTWTRDYPAIKTTFGDDVFVTVQNDGRRHADDDWAGSIELHVNHADGSWAGGGCTIYGPELKSYRGTEGIQEARVSYGSSSSREDGVAGARAGALMINLAADIADAWTAEATPALEVLAAECRAEYQAARKQAAADRAKRDAEIARRMSLVPDVGNTLRVRIAGKATPVVGELIAKDVAGISLAVSYRAEAVVIGIMKVEKLETKLTSTDRYDVVFAA